MQSVYIVLDFQCIYHFNIFILRLGIFAATDKGNTTAYHTINIIVCFPTIVRRIDFGHYLRGDTIIFFNQCFSAGICFHIVVPESTQCS